MTSQQSRLEAVNGDQAVRIGARLRAARTQRGLTLDQVAKPAGLTKGFVSRLERDDVSPSVASLVKVCAILGVRLGELFDPPPTSIIRAGQGKPINFGGSGASETLITSGTQSQLEIIYSVIEVGGNGGNELYSLNCDVECAYVLRGSVSVRFDTHIETLLAGDAMTFAGNAPHTWANASQTDPCEVLWILSPAP